MMKQLIMTRSAFRVKCVHLRAFRSHSHYDECSFYHVFFLMIFLHFFPHSFHLCIVPNHMCTSWLSGLYQVHFGIDNVTSMIKWTLAIVAFLWLHPHKMTTKMSFYLFFCSLSPLRCPLNTLCKLLMFTFLKFHFIHSTSKTDVNL